MQNKGCLIFLLAAGVLCALSVLGFLGLFAVKTVRVSPPGSSHVTVVERGANHVEVHDSRQVGLTTMPMMVHGSEVVWAKLFIFGAFPLGLLVAIFCIALFLRGRRKPRSCCASDGNDADEIQQMYANFKRMEQRLQTLETILTDNNLKK